MNDYMKLVAHAAAKYTGRPAVLSPLLDSHEWENKKNRFSSEPTKGDFRIILSSGGLSFEELDIELHLKPKPKEKSDPKPKSKEEPDPSASPKKDDAKIVEYEGLLKICMQQGSKPLGENFNWSRDCTYEYEVSTSISPHAHSLGVYWTDDDFLVIQARDLENPCIKESNKQEPDSDLKFRLIPTEVIDVLEPALNVPFLKQILRAIKKKSNDVSSYVASATEVSEENDVLSLLKCVPLTGGKKIGFDMEQQMMLDEEEEEEEAATEQPSQEESVSSTDPDDTASTKKPTVPQETKTRRKP